MREEERAVEHTRFFLRFNNNNSNNYNAGMILHNICLIRFYLAILLLLLFLQYVNMNE